MPTTVTSRAAHSEARVWSSGISRRQGAHQVAQKLITSDFPFHLVIGVGWPARSLSENAGRRAGTCGCGHASRSPGSGALAWPTGAEMPPCREARDIYSREPAQIATSATDTATATRRLRSFILECRACDPCEAPARREGMPTFPREWPYPPRDGTG